MNEKWFALSLPEIEKKLKTNAALGLTRKAARSRYLSRSGSLFDLRTRPPQMLILDIVSDFAFVILIILSLTAICFDEYVTGIVSSALIFLNLILALLIHYRSEKLCDKHERFFLPRCKVIRQGKLYEVGGENLVLGDIILVDEGDVLCCDARLITSDSLAVKMLTDKEKYSIQNKLAKGHVSQNENNVERHINMLHAGSVVLRGSGRAVVTATGRYTYIGAKIGSIFSASRDRQTAPHILKLLKKHCSTMSIALLIFALPFSFFAIFFGGTRISLLSAFMTVLAGAASSLAQLSTSLCRIFFTIPMKRCADADNSAIVRSVASFDKLSRTKYVFVLDGGALTDGILHFNSAFFADGEFSVGSEEKSNPSLNKLSQLVALYENSQLSKLSVGINSRDRWRKGISDFIDFAGCDRDALKIRCSLKGLAAEGTSELYDKVFFSDLGEELALCVSHSERVIDESEKVMVGGREVCFDAAYRSDISKKYKEYIESGKKVLSFALARHKGYGSLEGMCFVGMLAFSEATDVNAKRALSALNEQGVKTVFFKDITVNGRLPDISPIPRELILGAVADRGDFERSGNAVTYAFGKIDCYCGISDSQVCELINFIHKSGENIAVVGFSEKFERIYRSADVVISCSSDRKIFSEGIEQQTNDDDTQPIREEAPQNLKQRADIIIPRPRGTVGGIFSLVTAFEGAFGAYQGVAEFARYLMGAQAIRIFLVLIPMFFGGASLDARHILFGSMLCDVLALIGFACKEGAGKISSKQALNRIISLFADNFGVILCCSLTSLFAIIFPELVSLISGAPAYIDKTEYMFVVFVLLHISLLLGTRGIKFRRYSKNKDVFFLFSLGIIPLLLVMAFVVPVLSKSFNIEGFSEILYLFVALAAPIIFCVLCFVFRDARLNKKR